MSWFTFQIGSLLLNSANNVLDKRLVSEHDPNPITYLVSFAIVGVPVGIIGICIIPWFGWKPAATGLLIGMIFTIMVLLHYKALSLEDVSRLAPIARLSRPLQLVFFAVFIGDRLSSVQYVAFGMMTAGAAMLSWKAKPKLGTGSLQISNGMILMAIFALISAVYAILDGYMNVTYNPWIQIVWSNIGVVLGTSLVLLFPTQRRKLRQAIQFSSNRFRALLLGEQTIRFTAGVMTDFAVNGTGSAALISVFGGLRPLVVIILASVLLDEKFKRQEAVPKLIGAGLMGIGTGLLLIG